MVGQRGDTAGRKRSTRTWPPFLCEFLVRGDGRRGVVEGAQVEKGEGRLVVASARLAGRLVGKDDALGPLGPDGRDDGVFEVEVRFGRGRRRRVIELEDRRPRRRRRGGRGERGRAGERRGREGGDEGRGRGDRLLSSFRCREMSSSRATRRELPSECCADPSVMPVPSLRFDSGAAEDRREASCRCRSRASTNASSSGCGRGERLGVSNAKVGSV